MFVEDFSVMFGTGQPGVVSAAIHGAPAVNAMFDRDTQLSNGGPVLVGEISLLLPTPWASTAAEGQQVVIGGSTSYRIRQVLDEPPDGALRRLILAKA